MTSEFKVIVPWGKNSWVRRLVPREIRTAARGVLSAYLNRQVIKPYWVDIEQRGARIKFLVANRDGQKWYSPYVTYENREMTFLQEKMLRPGMTVVEAGAHQGFTAALIARWIGPLGKVYTFEPLQKNCDVATKVFTENKLENIVLTRAAVGDENGTAYIGCTTTNPNVQSNSFLGEASPLIRLDDKVEGPIDLLKIDVEGYEIHVLRGAKRLLETKPHLQIEIHPGPIADFGGNVADIYGLIDVNAYDFWLQEQSTTTEPKPFSPGDPVVHNSHLFAVRRSLN